MPIFRQRVAVLAHMLDTVARPEGTISEGRCLAQFGLE
jgi:hypothetical protein